MAVQNASRCVWRAMYYTPMPRLQATHRKHKEKKYERLKLEHLPHSTAQFAKDVCTLSRVLG